MSDSHGNLWGMGSNSEGQLGSSISSGDKSLKKIDWPFQDKIKTFSCGKLHLVVLTFSGQVYASGSNASGQIGCKGIQRSNSFVKISLTEPVIKIATGYAHTILLTSIKFLFVLTFFLKNHVESHSVFTLGSNVYHQLGSKTKSSDSNKIVKFEINDGPVSKIAGGGYHTFIVTTNGNLWCCGACFFQ